MVVLTLKNLQQQTFTVEIELSATVKALKEKVEKEKGNDYPAVGQKLIYAGKILQDDSTLDSYNIDEKKFLVIMVTKPKAAPSAEPSSPVETEEVASASASTPSSTDAATKTTTTPPSESAAAGSPTVTPVTTSSTAAPTSQSAPTTQAASGGSVGSAESLLVMGEEFNRMVENIMEMGYERSLVERALRASFNNPYTAVQYLVDGIPSNLDEPSCNQPAGEAEEQVAAEGEVDPDEDPLNFLRTQPQFEQMRQMIRSNPSLLDAFIQQIGQTNPQLLQVIQQNQEAFVRMLNEGGSSGGGSAGNGGNQGSGGSGGRTHGQNAILVSPQDREAIERLKALGNFPEDVVIQAYFACEKNENLAAEFLFSQTWD